MNEIESHNGIKRTASPVYFQRTSLLGHKEKNKTWLETNSPLKYKYEGRSPVSGCHQPAAQPCSLTRRLFGELRKCKPFIEFYTQIIYLKLFFILVKQTCLLLNYLRNQSQPSSPQRPHAFPVAPSHLIFL